METPGCSSLSDRGDMIIEVSPGMTEYYVPNCETSLRPFVGQNFKVLDDGIEFYKIYAKSSGFDIRLGSEKKWNDGCIIWKYIYCNREGDKNAAVEHDDICNEGKKKRRRVSRRFGCKARIVFRRDSISGYVVKLFEQRHSHPLIPVHFHKYLKANKNMDSIHKNFVLNCARVNVGPVRAFRFCKEFVGSYSNIGCTAVEFKNLSRDLKAYISGADAQMLVDKLVLKRESCSGFFFEYCVDKDDRLTRVFWADGLSRRNYALFGDVVSFDATYNTNRYAMIFTPFTGKDNHGKCVTFGVGLLSGESGESYGWVFEMFLKCMGHSPRLIITDQDLGMKTAIAQVFPRSRHRLCMWHIMLKMPDKVPVHMRKDDRFMKRLNDIVWSNQIEPSVFEAEWNELMVEYGLVNNSWFTHMFQIREFWIPAYFRDFPMSGLCRTTSISESVNSFFNRYLYSKSNMLELFMHFESAMDAQRHAADLQNCIDESSVPQLKTPLPLEKHAATVYTSHIFLKVQEEIMHCCFNCSVVEVNCLDSLMVYVVDDDGKFTQTVTFNKGEDTLVCSCKKYTMEGMLCCHVFLLLKNMKAVEIPQKYVMSRWTKNSLLKPLHCEGGSLFDNCDSIGDKKNLTTQLVTEFYSTLGLVEGNDEKMNLLLSSLKEFRSVLELGDDECASLGSKKRLFEQFYGSSTPAEINVHPPIHVKTKGSCSRLKPRKEAIAEKKKKLLRMCGRCHQLSDHDARNCKAVLSE